MHKRAWSTVMCTNILLHEYVTELDRKRVLEYRGGRANGVVTSGQHTAHSTLTLTVSRITGSHNAASNIVMEGAARLSSMWPSSKARTKLDTKSTAGLDK